MCCSEGESFISETKLGKIGNRFIVSFWFSGTINLLFDRLVYDFVIMCKFWKCVSCFGIFILDIVSWGTNSQLVKDRVIVYHDIDHLSEKAYVMLWKSYTGLDKKCDMIYKVNILSLSIWHCRFLLLPEGEDFNDQVAPVAWGKPKISIGLDISVDHVGTPLS